MDTTLSLSNGSETMQVKQQNCLLMSLPNEIDDVIISYLDLAEFLVGPKDGPEIDGFLGFDDVLPFEDGHLHSRRDLPGNERDCVYSWRGLHPKCYGNGMLKSQLEQYYGTHTDANDLGAKALLNWSSTCCFFRRKFMPRLVRDLILRTRKKSLASIEALSKTAHWESVESLAIRTTMSNLGPGSHATNNGDQNDGSDNLELLPIDDLTRLMALVANLPPNLKTLTLDFHADWHDDFLWMCFVPPIRGDFARLVHQVFNSVGENDISHKSALTLNLLNLPGGRLRATDILNGYYDYGTGFSRFLNHVTNLNIYLCRIGAADKGSHDASYFNQDPDVMSNFGSVLLEHLHKVETLKIESTPSCPRWILCSDRMHDVCFPIPERPTQLHTLRELTLSQFILDKRMVKFLCFNTPNLHHLTLSNCAVSLVDIERRIVKRSCWADFFSSLTNGALALRSLTLQHNLDSTFLFSKVFSAWEHPLYHPFGEHLDESGLDPGLWEHQDTAWTRKRARVLLTAQEAQKPAMTDKQWTQRKPVLHHVGMRGSDPYEIWWTGIQANAHRYVQGNDYEALMALSKDMEARGGEGFINATHATQDVGPRHKAR